ncbi:MAG TPA: DUF1592 domain-containing protein [Steroidobacteraceae bacterium]|nr:DUF1592 domain-containing protein [Steroidobacteraceae bacterium]
MMHEQVSAPHRSAVVPAICLASACLALAAMPSSSAQAASEQVSGSSAPSVAVGPAMLVRLSPNQYRQVVTDIFGSDIAIGGRFAPEIRQDGLLAIGAGSESITADELDQYHAMAQSIAAQVLDDSHRAEMVPCTPISVTTPDDHCASQFIAAVGELLYRRPLTAEELRTQIGIAHDTARQTRDFYAGLQDSLGEMLVSPEFLFEWYNVKGPIKAGAPSTLDAYARASKLSFLLWDSAPDQQLLDAARRGKLDSHKGLAREVDRMLASPRLQAGVRAFFEDMLEFQCADFPCEDSNFVKDTTIYPDFTPQVAADAEEQTLRTLVDLLITHDGDYRDIFTTRKTFLTPALAALYGVPVPRTAPNGEPTPWQAYAYAPGDPRAGILSEISFVAFHSHPGLASATLRGRALRQDILCEKVPDPPPNVSFKLVMDTSNPEYKTARERLSAHRSNPVCAGCHKLMDPMGLAMENFDSDGSFRTRENGVPIDTSGELDGVKFTGMVGLGKTVANNPAAPACLVRRLAAYALGREPTKDDAAWVSGLKQEFMTDHYRLPALLRQIATSDMLYRVEWSGAKPSPAVSSALASR